MASPTSPYTSQAISGYLASPPADDGTRVDSNKIEWAKHVDKIGDPIKNRQDGIDSQLVSAFNSIVMTTDPGEETVIVMASMFSH